MRVSHHVKRSVCLLLSLLLLAQGRWKTKPIGRTIRHRRIPVQTKTPLRRPRFDRLFLGKGGSKDGRTDRFWMGKDRKRASGWKWKNFMERKKDALCGAGRS